MKMNKLRAGSWMSFARGVVAMVLVAAASFGTPAATVADDGIGGPVAEVDPAADCDGDGVADSLEIARVLDLEGTSVSGGGRSSQWLAARDLDRDGILDLVAVAEASGEVIVHRGRGDGTFEVASVSPTGKELRGVSLGDLDGDGFLDVAATHRHTAGLFVFFGQPGGRLGDAVELPTVGESIPAVCLDLLDDERPEIIVGSDDTPEIFIFRVTRARDVELVKVLDCCAEQERIFGADLNADGRTDFAVVLYAGILVFPHLGDGELGAPIATDFDCWPSSVMPFDGDGDGSPDLLCPRGDTGFLGVHPGLGGGRFGAYRSLAVGPGRGGAVGDLDRNGVEDLVMIVDTDTLSSIIARGADPALGFKAVGRFRAPIRETHPILADFDGDGLLDVATSSYRAIGVTRGLGDGKFAVTSSIPLGRPPAALAADDFDRDGVVDVAVADTDDISGVTVFFRGEGEIGRPESVRLITGRNPFGIAIADLDVDGLPDIVTADDSDSSVSIFGNAGSREFRARRKISIGRSVRSVAVADFNEDGAPDIAAVSSNVVIIIDGVGGGEFGAPRQTALTNTGGDGLYAGHIDGDAHVDLGVRSRNERQYIEVLLGRGDGTFRPSRTLSFSQAGSSQGALFVDLDGDSKLDIAAVHERITNDEFFSFLVVFKGRGDGSFLPPVWQPVAPGIRTLGAGDIDGDHFVDLIVVTELGASVYLGDGKGTFTSDRAFFVGEDAFAILVDDLDNDRRADIVVANRDSKTLSQLSNRSYSVSADDCDGNRIPDACDIASGRSRDVDADGVLDECQPDCNGNGAPDPHDIASGTSPDCNRNGRPDACDVALRFSADCDGNGVPDTCELAAGEKSDDCDGNGALDICEIAAQPDLDVDANQVLDVCDGVACRVPGDCNADDRFAISDPICVLGYLFLDRPTALPCGDGSANAAGNIALIDWQPDGQIDLADSVSMLRFLFLGGPPHPRAIPGLEDRQCVPLDGCR